jgi:hypothetical protein
MISTCIILEEKPEEKIAVWMLGINIIITLKLTLNKYVMK